MVLAVCPLSGLSVMAPAATPPAGGAPPRGSASLPCANKRRGTSGHDRLIGTPSGDRLLGLSGDDVLAGRAADDCRYGGSGHDVLRGGAGHDASSAGSGNDPVFARNDRAETVYCGFGRDSATLDRSDRVHGCDEVRRG